MKTPLSLPNSSFVPAQMIQQTCPERAPIVIPARAGESRANLDTGGLSLDVRWDARMTRVGAVREPPLPSAMDSCLRRNDDARNAPSQLSFPTPIGNPGGGSAHLPMSGLSIIGICHSEPQAKNLKSFSKNLVRVLKRRNGGKDFRPFAVAQGDNRKTLHLPMCGL